MPSNRPKRRRVHRRTHRQRHHRNTSAVSSEARLFEKRFSEIVFVIEMPCSYNERIEVCIDNNSLTSPQSMVVKKVGVRDWRKRVKREAQVYRELNNVQGWDRHILELLAYWSGSTLKQTCLVTLYMSRGSLRDAIENGIDVAGLVVNWIHSAVEALDWLHEHALHVHTDTKTDNFLLSDDYQRLILFDFDECWSRSDFIGESDCVAHNFSTLVRYDKANFLADLEHDLQLAYKNDDAVLVSKYDRLPNDPTHADARVTLRGSLIGTVEEREWLAEETDDSECESVDVSDCEAMRRLRLIVAEENEVLQLEMRAHRYLMI